MHPDIILLLMKLKTAALLDLIRLLKWLYGTRQLGHIQKLESSLKTLKIWHHFINIIVMLQDITMPEGFCGK